MLADDWAGVGALDDAADEADVVGNANGDIFFLIFSNVSLFVIFLGPILFLGLTGLDLAGPVTCFAISFRILSSVSFSILAVACSIC